MSSALEDGFFTTEPTGMPVPYFMHFNLTFTLFFPKQLLSIHPCWDGPKLNI